MIRIDPLRLMRLAVLINCGTFRKAADELGVTQPALSQSIAQLEAEVGVRLIERTSRGIEPTIYGEALYSHAKAIDWELTQAVRKIEELAFGSKGALAVGATGGAAINMVSRAISRLQNSRPGINTQVLEQASTAVLIQQLHDRTLDLLICQQPSEFELRGARALKIFRSNRVACVRTGHPLGPCPNLADLMAFPFACPPDDMGLLSEIKKVLAAGSLELPGQKIIVSNSIAAAKEIVMRSNAFAVFSDLSVWTERESGHLVTLEIPNQEGYWYNLVSRPEHVATDVIKSFLKEVFSVCEELGVPVHADARRFESKIPSVRPRKDGIPSVG